MGSFPVPNFQPVVSINFTDRLLTPFTQGFLFPPGGFSTFRRESLTKIKCFNYFVDA